MKSAIARDGKTWWWIRLHDSQTELVTAANRLHVARGGERGHNPEDTLACFQPSPIWYLVDDDDGEIVGTKAEGYAGTMRFVAGRTSTEIVTHESMHCAFAIYRRRHEEDAQFGTDCGPREEDLVHIAGRVAAAVVDAIYSLGEWPGA